MTIQRTRYNPITTSPITSPKRAISALLSREHVTLSLLCLFFAVVTPLHHFIPTPMRTMLPSYCVQYVSVLQRPTLHTQPQTPLYINTLREHSDTAFANASALHYRSGNSNLTCKREKSCGFFVRRKIQLTTFPHIHCDHTFPCHSYIIRLCYPFQVTK